METIIFILIAIIDSSFKKVETSDKKEISNLLKSLNYI